jgi:hypothetical protein
VHALPHSGGWDSHHPRATARVSVHATHQVSHWDSCHPGTNCGVLCALLHSGNARPPPCRPTVRVSVHAHWVAIGLYYPNRPTARVPVHALPHSGVTGLPTTWAEFQCTPIQTFKGPYHPNRPTVRVSGTHRIQVAGTLPPQTNCGVSPAFRWLLL